MVAPLIADLAAELCPSVDETSPLDGRTKILVRSFIVLVHAEFENYVETLCLRRADAIKAEVRDGHCHPALVALTLRYANDLIGQRVPATDVSRTAATVCGLYGGLVKANNGIKRANIETLVSPLGLSSADLTAQAEEFVIATEALAALRGPAAHVGAAGFETDVYPSNARDAADEVLRHLPAFETLLQL